MPGSQLKLKLLGPVEATIDGRPVSLGPKKQRSLLAVLALHANETVSVDRLVDALWGERPPATARKMLQLYVSQLRRLLSEDSAQIVTQGRGYELRVDPDAVDVGSFERLVEEAARDRDVPNGAAHAALTLWQGAPLADVANEPFAAAEIRRLQELRLRAAELAIDDDLALGREQEALAKLERLIEDDPLRERFYAQRMLALYRAGRQAEALRCRARQRAS
jgi:DNA-binding SARP family transcriptional activator